MRYEDFGSELAAPMNTPAVQSPNLSRTSIRDPPIRRSLNPPRSCEHDDENYRFAGGEPPHPPVTYSSGTPGPRGRPNTIQATSVSVLTMPKTIEYGSISATIEPMPLSFT